MKRSIVIQSRSGRYNLISHWRWYFLCSVSHGTDRFSLVAVRSGNVVVCSMFTSFNNNFIWTVGCFVWCVVYISASNWLFCVQQINSYIPIPLPVLQRGKNLFLNRIAFFIPQSEILFLIKCECQTQPSMCAQGQRYESNNQQYSETNESFSKK